MLCASNKQQPVLCVLEVRRMLLRAPLVAKPEVRSDEVS
jgi:hypothetical protein